MSPEMLEKLRERISARVLVDEATGCWHWLGHKNTDGHGTIWFQARMILVHRAMMLSDITSKVVVVHDCGVRDCCNPDHLRVVAHQKTAG